MFKERFVSKSIYHPLFGKYNYPDSNGYLVSFGIKNPISYHSYVQHLKENELLDRVMHEKLVKQSISDFIKDKPKEFTDMMTIILMVDDKTISDYVTLGSGDISNFSENEIEIIKKWRLIYTTEEARIRNGPNID